MRTPFNKHKYIKVVKFANDKSMSITYYQRKGFSTPKIIDPNHVFNHNGYTTIIFSETSAQSINPLDFKSAFPASEFKTALESHLIRDAFTSLKSKKFDFNQILLVLSVATNFIVLYFLLKSLGIF